MTTTVSEAFDKHTEAFNSHDIDGFADTLADDAVFRAPGGIAGEGKTACVQFFGGWLDAFPDAHVEIHYLHIAGDVAVEEGEFTGTHHGVLRSPAGDVPATGRHVTVDYIEVLRFLDGKPRIVQPDVRPALVARTARPYPGAATRRLTPSEARASSPH